jgi:hypothetical protein
MSLLDMLQSLGDRLGVLQRVASTKPDETPRIETRTVTLAELRAEIRATEVRDLADRAGELDMPFSTIFETAGIATPPHGWTISRLRDAIVSQSDPGGRRQEVQKRILELLNEAKVSVEELVRDATARDQALDAFEAAAQKRLEERLAMRRAQLANLEGELRRLQQERDVTQELMQSEEEQWREWRGEKRKHERELAWTVGFLVEGPVITTEPND